MNTIKIAEDILLKSPLLDPEQLAEKNRLYKESEDLKISSIHFESPFNEFEDLVEQEMCIFNQWNEPRLNWKFLPEIPKIMRNIGWKIAPMFQEKWLSGKAHQLKGEAREGMGTDDRPLEIMPIDIDWVLKFDRAKKAYARIFEPYQETVIDDPFYSDNPYYFASKNALKVLKKILLDEFSIKNNKKISFGNFNAKVKDLDKQFINHYDQKYIYKLDELTGALGRFTFYTILSGEAEKMENEGIKINIQRVGIYMRDSFDFNDKPNKDQWLGSWRKPNIVSSSFSGGSLYTKKLCIDSPKINETYRINIANGTYREFRKNTGMGADFIIYSNVKVTPLKTPLIYNL